MFKKTTVTCTLVCYSFPSNDTTNETICAVNTDGTFCVANVAEMKATNELADEIEKGNYAVNISCSSSSKLSEICDTAAVFFADSSVNSIRSAYNYYARMKASKESDVWNNLSTYYTPNYNSSKSADTVLIFNANSNLVGNNNACRFSVGSTLCNVYNINITAFNKSFANKISNIASPSEKIYSIITYSENIKNMYTYKASLFGKLLLASNFMTNPKSDSDGDGTPDSKEFDLNNQIILTNVFKKSLSYSAGADQYKDLTGVDISKETIIPIKSDPTKEDSDDDGIVDAEDAQPLAKFDDRFDLSDNNYINITSDEMYNRKAYADSVYNTREPGSSGISKFKLNTIKARALASNIGFPFLHNACSFLNHFLSNTGYAYWYDADDIINHTDVGYKHYAENMNIIRELCESTVLNELCFISGYYSRFTGASFTSNSPYSSLTSTDWWFSVGDADATMSIRCKRNGDSYTAEVEYNILDFYDWTEGSNLSGGFVKDGEMFLLHAYGLAREMCTIGQYHTTMTWKQGERMSYK